MNISVSGWRESGWIGRAAAALAMAGAVGCTQTGDAGRDDGVSELVAVPAARGGSDGLRPLSTEPVPQPVGGHIVDQGAAIRLGKALFWDIQTGSDGQTACASCHFAGGADTRRINTLNPGLDGRFTSGGVTAPGQSFTPSNLVSDDRVGSQGVAAALFVAIDPDPSHPADVCTATSDAVFGTERQVTGRNAPTVIGAVFFRDAFWDGRANHTFNGFDPFGNTANADAAHALGAVSNGALASQATGPTLSPVEMSCAKRRFNDDNSLGAKLLARQPLQFQDISTGDSVLGGFASAQGQGLFCDGAPCTYDDLIRPAFGDGLADAAEASFSLIWGEAIQAYEATLIPDQTPFDRYLTGTTSALTNQQQRGLNVFQGKGNCTKCHAGSALSDATVSFFQGNGAINRDGGDQGFHNLGVRPTSEDLGRASLGPASAPFSVSGAAADRGAFKTPGLRNVKLTAPYFHNGGKATLADVVAFYARGGDFANPERASDLAPRSLSSDDQASLVDFLTNGLTDCRVELQRAPFDHPGLPLPNGNPLAATGATGLGSCP
jgi:cytochrome c peroxidase